MASSLGSSISGDAAGSISCPTTGSQTSGVGEGDGRDDSILSKAGRSCDYCGSPVAPGTWVFRAEPRKNKLYRYHMNCLAVHVGGVVDPRAKKARVARVGTDTMETAGDPSTGGVSIAPTAPIEDEKL